MGLRCLLGHDFGEPELQREREEEGDEVVTTVKEVKTCARCGETQIVSENTEVTTMEQLADEAAANAAGGSDAGANATPAERGSPDQSEADAGAGEAPGRGDADGATAGDGVTLDEEPDAGTDDAVIIDDGPAADEGTEAGDAGQSPGGVDAARESAERPSAAGGSGPADGSVSGDDPGEEDA